ncbi:MAG: flagellar protein FlaG [Lachnospiraceae bacterium]|nr:flagellar protein FlaG [Lachnospiraceae bacterium]
MSIEPIGTLTSVQMQTTTKISKPVDNMEVSTQPQPNSVDTVTKAIEKVSNSANKEGQEGNQSQSGSNESARLAAQTYNKLTENTKAVFGVNEATNRVTIKIVDKDTDEIIKEFPAEKTLDMIARVWEMAGLMVDEKR